MDNNIAAYIHNVGYYNDKKTDDSQKCISRPIYSVWEEQFVKRLFNLS